MPGGNGFLHEALVYRDDADFLDGAAEFLRAGVSAGESVFALLPPASIERLRTALDGDLDQVRLLDVTEVGRNPARIIPTLRSLAGSGAHPARGLVEPAWPGQNADETAETQLHEALVNLAFDGFPLHLRCAVDATGVPADVVDGVGASHPVVLDAGDRRVSDTFDPKHARVEFAKVLPEPDSVSDVEHFSLDDLPELRDLVTVRASGFGLPRDRALDLTLATNEIVTNSICHGGERGTLRLWDDGDSMVCEVTDSGQIADPLVGRTVPQPSMPGGRGVWLANQLCDLVQIRSSPVGTVVRLHMNYA